MDWKFKQFEIDVEVLSKLEKEVHGGQCLDQIQKDYLSVALVKAQLMLAERLEAFYALQTKETASESAPGTESAPGGPSGGPESNIGG